MKKIMAIILVVLALLAILLSGVYFTHAAGALPHFFPGYIAGSAHKHLKHGVAFVTLAIVLLLGAWMVGGSSSSPTPSTHN